MLIALVHGLQVVSLSCGMDTRPWRLRRGAASRGPGSAKLRWFEVDHQAVLETKAKVGAGQGAGQAEKAPFPGTALTCEYCLLCVSGDQVLMSHMPWMPLLHVIPVI